MRIIVVVTLCLSTLVVGSGPVSAQSVCRPVDAVDLGEDCRFIETQVTETAAHAEERAGETIAFVEQLALQIYDEARDRICGFLRPCPLP